MKTGDISELIKKWRKKRGLSLSQMAKRVDTSPAALSRYENGWQRFEIYSLRKIAAALNCRLYVDFVPIHNYKNIQNEAEAWKKMKRLFWDKKINRNDLVNYPEWVIKRVLEYGKMEDVKFIISFLGEKIFFRNLLKVKFSSKKTDIFWQNILKKENITCMKKPLQNREKNYWPH